MNKLKRTALLLPLLACAALIVLDPFIARIVLPFREVLLGLCLLQILISANGLRARRAARESMVEVAAIMLALGLGVATTVREYAIRERTVTFPSGGVSLVGTVYLPAGADTEPHPAMVVVHGSGKFPRRLYRYWGQRFAALGFQVLVYDKRGVGDSGGTYEGENNTSAANIQRLAEDASSAASFMAAQPNVSAHLGYFGVSQGGWVATLAARLNPKVRFLLMHSGPPISVGEQNAYADLTGEGHGTGGLSVESAEARIAEEPAAGFDPRSALAGLDVTALWMFGSADKNVPVQKSLRSLAALRALGQPFEYEVLPAADHLLLTRDTRFSRASTDAYWSRITQWMSRHESRQLLRMASKDEPDPTERTEERR